MPYCGRPSAGCHTCRKRKIKCDRAEPTCRNCAKAGWICHGYRNTIDLLFHDETLKVVGRVKVSKDEQRPPSVAVVTGEIEKVEREHHNDEIKRGTAHQQKDLTQMPLTFPSPETALSLNLDELAVAYFFFYYVFRSSDESDAWKAIEESSCLLAGIRALGSAGVTRSGFGHKSSHEAQLRYLDAIKLTNSALRCPTEVKKDSTLLAVNLLAIFETTSGFNSTLKSWHDHIQGAAALLQYRGTKQFETADGGRLFLQTASALVVSCTKGRWQLPMHVNVLVAKAAEHVPDPEDPAWVSFCLTIRFANLYAKLLPNNLLRSAEDAELIFKEAFILDQDIVALMDNFPEDWRPVKYCAGGPFVFNGYLHAFRETFVASQYYSLLNKRIVLQDIMLKALWPISDLGSLNLSDAALRHVQNASGIIQQLQRDILAIVPQHLGSTRIDLPASFTTGWSQKDNLWGNFMVKDRNPWRCRKSQAPRLPFVKVMGGISIHWPVYRVGTSDVMGGSVRMWATKILRVFGQSVGLRQAVLLADMLETGEGEQLNAHTFIPGDKKD